MPCARRRASSATAPTAAASLLARRRTHLLGVLLDVTSPFHAELVRALDTASADRGLRPGARHHDGPHRASTVPPRRCSTSGARRWCCSGPQMSDADLTALATHCPTVAVGRAGTARGRRGCWPPTTRGSRRRSTTSPRWVTSASRSSTGPRGSIARARREGYREAMARHGFRAGADVLRGGGHRGRRSVRGGAAAARGRRATGPRPSSPSTTGWRSACAMPCCGPACGCPEDVSVVGYDDSPMARLGTIDLTSVSQEPEALADATVAVVATCSRAGAGEHAWPTSSSRRASSCAPRPAPPPGRE